MSCVQFFDRFGKSSHTFDVHFLAHVREVDTHGVFAFTVHEEHGSENECHVFLDGDLEQFFCVVSFRQVQEQELTTFRTSPCNTFRHVFFEST